MLAHRTPKAPARQEHTSLRYLVVEGLRHEVERRSHRRSVDFSFPTVSGHGLNADLPPGDTVTASYDLPA